MSNPIYKIYGKERKKLKKELSLSRWFVKDFWSSHEIEKDMTCFFDGRMMSDEDARKLFDETKARIIELEDLLKEKI